MIPRWWGAESAYSVTAGASARTWLSCRPCATGPRPRSACGSSCSCAWSVSCWSGRTCTRRTTTRNATSLLLVSVHHSRTGSLPSAAGSLPMRRLFQPRLRGISSECPCLCRRIRRSLLCSWHLVHCPLRDCGRNFWRFAWFHLLSLCNLRSIYNLRFLWVFSIANTSSIFFSFKYRETQLLGLLGNNIVVDTYHYFQN